MPADMEDASLDALRDVITQGENFIEALAEAAEAIEAGGYSRGLAIRLRAWATVVENPLHESRRIVHGAEAKAKQEAAR